MSNAHELYILTSELFEISNSEMFNNVEEKIQDINIVLEKREKILSKINLHLLDEKDEKFVKQVIEMDRVINERLNHIMMGIKIKLNNIKKSKHTQKKYINPYSQVIQASRFFDKKK